MSCQSAPGVDVRLTESGCNNLKICIEQNVIITNTLAGVRHSGN
ncbi:unnamed protein product, partial [Staurois parvus]